MDAIRDTHRKCDLVMEIETVLGLYDCGLSKSKAAKFGVRSIVHDLCYYPSQWKDGKDSGSIKKCSSHAELMSDVLEEILRTLAAKAASPEVSPDELTGCVFHEHKAGLKCSPNKRKREQD